MGNSSIITLIIAICGADVASVAILWNVYTYSKDKGILNVQCKFMVSDEFEQKLRYDITNDGKRSITVSEVGYSTKDEEFPLKCDINEFLDPGKSCTIFVNILVRQFCLPKAYGLKILSAIFT